MASAVSRGIGALVGSGVLVLPSLVRVGSGVSVFLAPDSVALAASPVAVLLAEGVGVGGSPAVGVGGKLPAPVSVGSA